MLVRQLCLWNMWAYLVDLIMYSNRPFENRPQPRAHYHAFLFLVLLRSSVCLPAHRL